MNFNNIVFETSFGTKSQLKKSTYKEIVLSGRSNVGKSSLINKLANKKSLARTSSKPGKTGTINFYTLDNVKLVDLPGYGYAKISFTEKKRWADLVDGYFNSNRKISLVIQLIDIRHGPSQDDLNMINFLKFNNFNFIIVLTKSDKLNKIQKEAQIINIKNKFLPNGFNFIVFSAVTGEGLKNIKNIIESTL